MHNKAIVNYHTKSDTSQAFHFDIDGITGKLVSPELVPTEIYIKDVRGNTCTVDFDRDGIVFAKAPTQIADFEKSKNWEKSYNNELRALLKQKIGAREVIIFDHTVRINHPNAVRKPARNVHNDYSHSSAELRLIDIVGQDRSREFRSGAFGFVNVWRPVEHAIKSWPLGFIRPSSMKSDDWMMIELVYPDRRGQILGVAANEDHEWFYLSEMTPDEVAIFVTYDNRGRPYLAHGALHMDGDGNASVPRKSIESRTLIRYA